MSEENLEDVNVDEISADEVETNPIMDFVQAIEQEQYSSATDIFADQINDRLADRLDAKRVEVATNVFNDPVAEEDFEVEELEADEEFQTA